MVLADDATRVLGRREARVVVDSKREVDRGEVRSMQLRVERASRAAIVGKIGEGGSTP